MVCSESIFSYAVLTSNPASLSRHNHCYKFLVYPSRSFSLLRRIWVHSQYICMHTVHISHLLISSQYSVLEIVPNTYVKEKGPLFLYLLVGHCQVYTTSYLASEVSFSSPLYALKYVWICVMKHVCENVCGIKFLPVKVLGHRVWMFFVVFFLDVACLSIDRTQLYSLQSPTKCIKSVKIKCQ